MSLADVRHEPAVAADEWKPSVVLDAPADADGIRWPSGPCWSAIDDH